MWCKSFQTTPKHRTKPQPAPSTNQLATSPKPATNSKSNAKQCVFLFNESSLFGKRKFLVPGADSSPRPLDSWALLSPVRVLQIIRPKIDTVKNYKVHISK